MFATILSQLIPMVIGRAASRIPVEGKIIDIPAIKGLIQSKTAKAATSSLMMKIAGALMFPGIPEWVRWVGVGAFIVEWGVNLYLRAITKEPIGE